MQNIMRPDMRSKLNHDSIIKKVFFSCSCLNVLNAKVEIFTLYPLDGAHPKKTLKAIDWWIQTCKRPANNEHEMRTHNNVLFGYSLRRWSRVWHICCGDSSSNLHTFCSNSFLIHFRKGFMLQKVYSCTNRWLMEGKDEKLFSHAFIGVFCTVDSHLLVTTRLCKDGIGRLAHDY